MKKVVFSPGVEQDLTELFQVLVRDGYLSYESEALQYVEDLVHYIQENISLYPCKPAPLVFARYGTNLKYLPYKRNNRTTWYAIFQETDTHYLIVKITNNNVSAQYFN